MAANDVLEALPAGLVLVDGETREVVFSNQPAVALLGQGALVGEKFPFQTGPGKHVIPGSEVELAGIELEVARHDRLEIVLIREHQEPAWSSLDTERLAFEDTLTGLPNLNILRQFIEFTCTQSHRYNRSSCLLLIGLEQLHTISNELGQSAVDDLLCLVGARLQQSVRSSDIVGRHSQDKFMIILTELTSDRSKDREAKEIPVPRRAAIVAERMLREFAKPFDTQGNPLHVQISVGVSICPGLANTPEEFLEQAEIALSQARAREGQCYVTYEAAYAAIVQQQKQQAEQLQSVLSGDAFCLEPLVELGSDKTLAIMLKPGLLHADGGDIWELADAIGLGPQMFDWLVRSHRALAQRLGERAAETQVILPLRARQLLNADLGTLLTQVLTGFGKVVLRIPESAVGSESSKRLGAVRRLQEQGFQIMLETGPRGIHSLPLLQQLKPRYLELAPSLVDRPMLTACCMVARQFGVDVAARGVSTREQADWLMEQGCRLALGPAWANNLTDS